ncbi:hypothetical protein [Paenibacillus sp. 23TSA30-6]|uniref:hypothetical protein n=1 Tax=Paenibacillus sp. 23TSA30-6 TaxID=2546104 RepID=UPI00178850BE|nr:hypothetical protein [Paenibacillus sp. 23TSA30-6]MBE0336214.1 hypothetical protein [Paenibacillus sp. 23TSA30-6]
MKKVSLLLICLFCIFGSNAFASNAEDIPSEVRSAAEQGLKSFISDATQSPSEYGYANAEEVNRIGLGEGYKLYAVDKNLLNKESNSLKDYTLDTGGWLFTIQLNGVAKNYLTVALEDGEYKTVQVGGNANNYGNALARIKSEHGDPEVVQAGPAYYFVAKDAAKDSVKDIILSSVPENKASLFQALGNDEYRTTSEVITFLKKQASSNNDNSGTEKLRGGGFANAAPEANTNINQILIVSAVVLILGAVTIVFLRKKTNRG